MKDGEGRGTKRNGNAMPKLTNRERDSLVEKEERDKRILPSKNISARRCQIKMRKTHQNKNGKEERRGLTKV